MATTEKKSDVNRQTTEQVICPKCGKEQSIPHSDEPAIWCQCQHCGDRFLAERDK